MGDNLLLAYIPAARITKQRRRILHRQVDNLSESDVNNEEIAALSDQRDVRQMLREHVDLLPANPWQHRDVLEMSLPHMPYPVMFTGGPSWGDSASDLLDAFCCLGVLPSIYQRLRIWAMEDEKFRRSRIRSRRSA